MNRLTDQQLLRDYSARRSETAFAELVRRCNAFAAMSRRKCEPSKLIPSIAA